MHKFVKIKKMSGCRGSRDYDQWRYNYPKFDTAQRWAKVPSQELSDFIIDDAMKNDHKKD